jgi:hypothetical protein
MQTPASTPRRPAPESVSIASALIAIAGESVTANSLATEREAHHVELGEKRVEFRQFCLACAGQVPGRNVDDLMRIAEIRGAHVFRIGSHA